MSEQFRQWLADEMNKRRYSQRTFAKEIEISQPFISRVLSGETPPSVDFCVKVAQVFNVPPETVLRLAGILPASPTEDNPLLQEAMDTLQNLPPAQLKDALRYLRFLLQNSKNE